MPPLKEAPRWLHTGAKAKKTHTRAGEGIVAHSYCAQNPGGGQQENISDSAAGAAHLAIEKAVPSLEALIAKVVPL